LRDEAAARAFTAEDPVVKAGIGFAVEIMRMPSIVLP
jgi:hypothetical protein